MTEGFSDFLVFVALVAYFIPLVVAAVRGHPNGARIGAVSLLFGWTVIVWVISLVWAFSRFEKPKKSD